VDRRINAAARQHDLSYSRFMNGLKLAGVEVNRKVLADLAVREPEAFGALVEQAKAKLTSCGCDATRKRHLRPSAPSTGRGAIHLGERAWRVI
jgi:hypothetical protein